MQEIDTNNMNTSMDVEETPVVSPEGYDIPEQMNMSFEESITENSNDKSKEKQERRVSHRKKRVSLDQSYDHDSGDEEDGNKQLKNIALASLKFPDKTLNSLKVYFLERLYQVLYLLQAKEENMIDWKVEITVTERGLLSSIIDVLYFNSKNRKFRSRVEIASSLSLMPPIKNSKTMTKDQFYLAAMEMREKLLISQLLISSKGECDEIRYVNDIATIVVDTKEYSSVLPISRSKLGGSMEVMHTDLTENSCFAFGNITVLSWGNIIPNAAFHTSTQIYPLGFKCLRQEQDTALDKVVECLCEIDATDETETEYYSKLPSDKNQADFFQKELIPLFRLTITWIIPNSPNQIRVYEARSPQQVWQAAMLEKIGTNNVINEDSTNEVVDETSNDMNQVTSDRNKNDSNGDVNPNNSIHDSSVFPIEESEAFCDMDDEEFNLRKQIRELRKHYFRLLRNEQKFGDQEAVIPRLALDDVNSFADEGIIRLIEGMQNTLECLNYTFVDSRDQDTRRNIYRGYAIVNDKLKVLSRLNKKTYPSLYVKTQSNDGNGEDTSDTPVKGKRRKTSSNESSNDVINKTESLGISIKEQKALLISFSKLRNANIRKVELSINLIRMNLTKQTKKLKDNIKIAINNLAIDESKFSRSLNPKEFYMKWKEEKPYIQYSKYDEVILKYQQNEVISPLLNPSNGMILLDSTIFWYLLEIWNFIRTFIITLNEGDLVLEYSNTIFIHGSNSIDISVFELDQEPETKAKRIQDLLNTYDIIKLCNALKRCDPFMKHLFKCIPNLWTSLDMNTNRFPSFHGKKMPGFQFNEDSSADLLDNIGLLLTTSLVNEFETIMGIDQLDPLTRFDVYPLNLPDLKASGRIIYNDLTWREIARVALIATCGKMIGISDADITNALKGNGHTQTPDTIDKKVLRLIKRRMLYAYSIRKQTNEQLIGFNSGICIRLPTPSFCYYYQDDPKSLTDDMNDDIHHIDWMNLLNEIQFIPIRFGWLIHDLIYIAIMICPNNEMKEQLKQYISYMSYTSTIIIAIKKDINILMQSFKDSMNRTYLRIFKNISFYSFKIQQFLLSFQHIHTKTSENTRSIQLKLMEEDVEGEEMIVEDDDEEKDKDDSMALEDNEETIVKEKNNKNSISMESDYIEAMKLSLLMQRCYQVIVDIMNHSLSIVFINMVDPKTAANYYHFIAQPICLHDIRQHLVNGLYEDKMGSFYTDVMLLFGNSIAYNPEPSSVHQAALKLILIFERLFFEIVLKWNDPLKCGNQSCHTCRMNIFVNPTERSSSATSIDITNTTSKKSSNTNTNPNPILECERCEAKFHLHCTTLSMIPKGDWYCHNCIQCTNIAMIHPNKFSIVRHPLHDHLLGRVINIKQNQYQLEFIIEFQNNNREVWNSSKVRQYCLYQKSYLSKSTLPNSNDFNDSMNSTLSKTQLDNENKEDNLPIDISSIVPMYDLGIPELPNGYNYDEYDKLCCLVRGYQGWGSYHMTVIPPYLSETHCLYSQQKRLIDPNFDLTCLAISYLGSNGSLPEDLNTNDLVVIYKAIINKLLTTPVFERVFSSIGDRNMDAMQVIKNNIFTNKIGFEKLIHDIDYEFDVSSIMGQVNDEDEDENNQPNTEVSTTSNVATTKNKASKKINKVNSSVEKKVENIPEVEVVKKKKVKIVIDEESDDDSDSQSLFDEEDDGYRDHMDQEEEDEVEENLDEETAEDDLDDEEELFSNEEVEKFSSHNPEVSLSISNAVSISEPIAKGPETEDMWEHRRLSRRRGREDALANHSVIMELLSQVDVDCVNELQDCNMNGTTLPEGFGDFYSTAMPSIIKQCIVRVPDEIDLLEWERGFESKTRSIIEEVQRIPQSSSDELVCCFCGNDEVSLNSIFVWGQSWNEFIETKIPVMDILSGELIASNASTDKALKKGRYAKYLAARSILWKPCCESDTKIEENEIQLVNRRFAHGSIRVHEYCAEIMETYRESYLQKVMKSETRRISNIFSGLGRSKTISIGRDRVGNSYWIFHGMTGVFVSSGSLHNDILQCVDTTAKAEKLYEEYIDHGSFKNNDETDQSFHWEYVLNQKKIGHSDDDCEEPCIWRVYVSTDDIAKMFQRLDRGDPYDRQIYRALELLFPDAATMASTTTFNNVVKARDSEKLSSDTSKSLYKIHDEVIVYGVNDKDLLWHGRVKDIARGVKDKFCYLISYEHWPSDSSIESSNKYSYETWINETEIKRKVCTDSTSINWIPTQNEDAYHEIDELRMAYIEENVAQAPDILRSLKAYVFIHAPNRVVPQEQSGTISFSNATNSLEIIRLALLIMQQALPVGSIDTDSEEKWGLFDYEEQVDFLTVWKEACIQAKDVTSLMEAVLMLEYGIRIAWLNPVGLKTMTCMPSRIHCLRNPTIGLLAMKVWILDSTIRYDKFTMPNRPSVTATATTSTTKEVLKLKTKDSSNPSALLLHIPGRTNNSNSNSSSNNKK